MAGLIKNSYRVLATLSLLNFLVLGGGVGYLVAAGRLDAEQVKKLAAVLRGEDEADADAVEPSTPTETDPKPGKRAPVVSKEEKQIRDEIMWRNAERYRTQLEQRLKFINAERLDVDRRREEFERLANGMRTEREKAAQRAKQPGYVKELEVIKALSPNAALSQLVTMNDADVARILFELDTRKTKKIVEAAKTDAQRSKVNAALLLMRDIKRVDDGETSDRSDG